MRSHIRFVERAWRSTFVSLLQRSLRSKFRHPPAVPVLVQFRARRINLNRGTDTLEPSLEGVRGARDAAHIGGEAVRIWPTYCTFAFFDAFLRRVLTTSIGAQLHATLCQATDWKRALVKGLQRMQIAWSLLHSQCRRCHGFPHQHGPWHGCCSRADRTPFLDRGLMGDSQLTAHRTRGFGRHRDGHTNHYSPGEACLVVARPVATIPVADLARVASTRRCLSRRHRCPPAVRQRDRQRGSESTVVRAVQPHRSRRRAPSGPGRRHDVGCDGDVSGSTATRCGGRESHRYRDRWALLRCGDAPGGQGGVPRRSDH